VSLTESSLSRFVQADQRPGAYSAASILALSLSWRAIERVGAKRSLYGAQVFLGIACTVEVLARNWGAWLASKVLFVCD
jgi:hypothetical protein